MKLVLISAVISLTALAFVRTTSSAGAAPSAATDGVSLYGVAACRALVYVTDSGTINGGTLRSYYYDSTAGWVRSNTDQDCVLETAATKGLSSVASHVCEYEVLNKAGRFAMAVSGLTGVDGGSPNGVGTDGGQNVEPIVKLDCYGEGRGQ